jgi:hypothetical protein
MSELNNDVSMESLQAELARLKAENAALTAVQSRGLSCKISEKGGMSVYGLGRFPVTLYKDQWLKFFSSYDSIKAFFTANVSRMSDKPAKD